MEIRIKSSIIKELQAQGKAEKQKLAAKIKPDNQTTGVHYTTLLRYLMSNHHILTLVANQVAIKEHLNLDHNFQVLETIKRGRWVEYSEKEVAV